MKGEVTCKDSSLVDCALLNINSLNTYTPHFKVLEFSNLLSDVHKPIQIQLEVKQKSITQHTCYDNDPQIQIHNNNKIKPAQWITENAPDLCNNIDKNAIEKLNETLLNVDTNNSINRDQVKYVINNTVAGLNKCIIDAAGEIQWYYKSQHNS